MPYSEYRCENSVCFYGNPLFAAPVRDAAVAIFGSLYSWDLESLNRDRSGPPLIALVSTTTPQLPPVGLVAEFSRRAPELTLNLDYHHYDIARNGSLEFKGGRVIHEWHDEHGRRTRRKFYGGSKATVAEVRAFSANGSPGQQPGHAEDSFLAWLADLAKGCGRPVHALPDESGRLPVSSLPSLRAVAEELLQRALVSSASDFPEASMTSGPVSQCAEATLNWAAYNSVRALLTAEEVAALEAACAPEEVHPG
jgi:hypothetical protein